MSTYYRERKIHSYKHSQHHHIATLSYQIVLSTKRHPQKTLCLTCAQQANQYKRIYRDKDYKF